MSSFIFDENVYIYRSVNTKENWIRPKKKKKKKQAKLVFLANRAEAVFSGL